MARYLVSMNSADDATAQAAITGAGATVESTLNFGLTYEIEATPEQLSAITDVAVSEAKDTTLSVSLQTTVWSGDHLDYSLHPTGLGSWDPNLTGSGKTVYLVDTGISVSHQEFAGATITNCWSNFSDDDAIPNYDDAVGHGTAVASMIVGQNIGTAKDAHLRNVKMFNSASGNITVGEIISGLDAVLADHITSQSDVKVVCLPWNLTKNDFVDAKVREMNASNLVVVAAAGNDGVDVNTVSPAGVDNIITVGSYDYDLQVTAFTNAPRQSAPSFVNYGAELDIFAPGVGITVADSTNDEEYVTSSGTSLSAGIVAGIATHYIGRNSSWSSSEVKETMLLKGHALGVKYLIFDEADPSVDYSGVYKAVITTENKNPKILATIGSGRLANVSLNQSQTINLGINSDATDLSVLDFAPTPPWISANVSTGDVTIDTNGVDASLAPGIYLFAIRGQVNGMIKVEEYSVGLYNADESELNVDSANVSSFYYDTDNTEYDEVLNYQISTQKP